MVRGALLAARRCRRNDDRRSSSRIGMAAGYRSNERCAARPTSTESGVLAGGSLGSAPVDPPRRPRHLRVVRGIGQVAQPLVLGLPLRQFQERVDREEGGREYARVGWSCCFFFGV